MVIRAYSRKWIRAFGAVACIGAGCVLAMWVFWHQANATDQIAKGIVEQCRAEVDHATCYERHIPVLYPKLSISQIFDVVRAVRRGDPQYQYCHILGHRIGERVVAEDPERWLEDITYNPIDGLCSNGYIHGVLKGRFSSEVLDGETLDAISPYLSKVCMARGSWEPTGHERAVCYVGIGRLYTYLTGGELPLALETCESTAPADFRSLCVEGVFMQVYERLGSTYDSYFPNLPERPNATTTRTFCMKFREPGYQGACLRQSWPLFRSGIVDGSRVTEFCARQPTEREMKNCFYFTSGVIGREGLGHPEMALAACANIPETYRHLCYVFAARAYLEEDHTSVESAISLCERAPAPYNEKCAVDLLGQVEFVLGDNSARLKDFCSVFKKYFSTSCDTTPRQL